MTAPDRSDHWIGAKFRELRQAMGLSLSQFETKFGISAVVMGSYERGDRRPSLEKADELLRTAFGKKLIVVDCDYEETSHEIVRTPLEMASALEDVARQLRERFEESHDKA